MFYFMVVIANFNGLHKQHDAKGSPSLFLLIAPPSVAAVAIDLFDGDPDTFSTVASIVIGWCLVVFLFLCKIGPEIIKQPSVLGLYWAYVFPLSSLASTLVKYAKAERTKASEILAVFFVCLAVLALAVVFLRMTYHQYLCLRGKTQWGDPLLTTQSVQTDHSLLVSEVRRPAHGRS